MKKNGYTIEPYADLRFADLRGADLRELDLSGIDFRHSDLRFTDLRGADLRFTDLRGADLRGANLRGTDLRGTCVISGGYDTRGLHFIGVGNEIQAGCRRWRSANEARAYYGPDYTGTADIPDCIARIDIISARALRRKVKT